jgi:hypothetical protein
MTGKPMERLESKVIPIECQFIYGVFSALSNARAGNDPITFSEMKAYCDLNAFDLSRNQIETIQRFDTVLLNKRNEMFIKYREQQ